MQTSDQSFGLVVDQRPELPAPSETTDPVEILMRNEIRIGININGQVLTREMCQKLAIELNITIDF